MIKRQIIQGFTLIELLVVVSLLAVLATVALIANEGVNEQAEIDATKYEMAELRKALLQFKRDVGAFPDDLLQLGSYSASAVAANGENYPEWDKYAVIQQKHNAIRNLSQLKPTINTKHFDLKRIFKENFPDRCLWTDVYGSIYPIML